MNKSVKNHQYIDPDINPDTNLYINKSLYKDTYTGKDNFIKIINNKGIREENIKSKYDYLSLRNILQEEMDKPLTEAQAQVIGDALVDLYQAMYFDDI